MIVNNLIATYYSASWVKRQSATLMDAGINVNVPLTECLFYRVACLCSKIQLQVKNGITYEQFCNLQTNLSVNENLDQGEKPESTVHLPRPDGAQIQSSAIRNRIERQDDCSLQERPQSDCGAITVRDSEKGQLLQKTRQAIANKLNGSLKQAGAVIREQSNLVREQSNLVREQSNLVREQQQFVSLQNGVLNYISDGFTSDGSERRDLREVTKALGRVEARLMAKEPQLEPEAIEVKAEGSSMKTIEQVK